MCERCEHLEKVGAKRGHYIQEFLGKDRAKERVYGPYATSGCAHLAVRRGALRSKCYTAARYSAHQAKLFAANALPVSKAPRRAPKEKPPVWTARATLCSTRQRLNDMRVHLAQVVAQRNSHLFIDTPETSRAALNIEDCANIEALCTVIAMLDLCIEDKVP